MLITCLMLTIFFLTFICVIVMFYKWYQQAPVFVSPLDYIKLSISGILAFIADSIGLGSFAVNIALAKMLKTFPDEELPAMNNGAQIIPGALESLFFMKLVQVDWLTLFTLVGATCIGGLIGGKVVSGFNKQAIRLTMMWCFAIVILILLCNQLGFLPKNGNVVALRGITLLIGFFALVLCGVLTAAGIGLFCLVQTVLFLLNVSPLVAFPIMTTAGAMQQPLTTLVFLKNGKIPLKKTFILSGAGCIGVGLTMLFFTNLSAAWLHGLLVVILSYNLYSISKAYWQSFSPTALPAFK